MMSPTSPIVICVGDGTGVGLGVGVGVGTAVGAGLGVGADVSLAGVAVGFAVGAASAVRCSPGPYVNRKSSTSRNAANAHRFPMVFPCPFFQSIPFARSVRFFVIKVYHCGISVVNAGCRMV